MRIWMEYAISQIYLKSKDTLMFVKSNTISFDFFCPVFALQLFTYLLLKVKYFYFLRIGSLGLFTSWYWWWWVFAMMTIMLCTSRNSNDRPSIYPNFWFQIPSYNIEVYNSTSDLIFSKIRDAWMSLDEYGLIMTR